MSQNKRARRLLEHVHETCSGLDAGYLCVVQVPGEELSDVASNLPLYEAVSLLRELALQLERGAVECYGSLRGAR